MRRPLCLVGLAFVTALLLGIHLLPHDPPDCGIPEGKTAAAVGGRNAEFPGRRKFS